MLAHLPRAYPYRGLIDSFRLFSFGILYIFRVCEGTIQLLRLVCVCIWNLIFYNLTSAISRLKVVSSYFITLLGSTPQLAAMITLGCACIILVHSSLAAKPG